MNQRGDGAAEPGGVPGIHHVTAICGDPQANMDFYSKVLGLRFVKKTVNFDDPGTYHLYYGNGLGQPGTIMTFFPWPGRPRGRRGHGQVTVTAFHVPEGSLEFWLERLKEQGVACDGPRQRFGEAVAVLEDPDGLRLELVAAAGAAVDPWEEGNVPAEHAIRGFYGVTLSVDRPEASASLLAELGFQRADEEQHEGSGRQRVRFVAGEGAAAGSRAELLVDPALPVGRVAVGSVHHVAWRAPGDAEQQGWQRALGRLGVNVTPVIDRQYFRSIYFREPSGILFEIATDPPGFTLDEPADRLGSELKLPPQLEAQRERIEARLPDLTV